MKQGSNVAMGISVFSSNSGITTTSADGSYRFDGLFPGLYEISVFKDGYSPISITREFRETSNLLINLRPFMEVLHHSDSERLNYFQFATYVYSYGEKVNRAEIISPNGYVRELEHNIHFDEGRFSSWWNDVVIENGEWTVKVFNSD